MTEPDGAGIAIDCKNSVCRMFGTQAEVVALRETLAWAPEEFAAHFAGSPIKRLKLHRWLRNALVVLGNTGAAADLPAVEALVAHPDPMVAWHAERAAARLRVRIF